MKKQDFIQKEIECIFNEIKDYINMLYIVTDIYTKNLLLNQMWNKVTILQTTLNYLLYECNALVPEIPRKKPQLPTKEPEVPNQKTSFTLEELAKFNGKKGNPAYIAVNGLVYDVTNNAAWAAASHFGLMAGNDLTSEFATCHTGQNQILEKLKIVGRLTR